MAGPRTLREAWERVERERAEECLRRGRAPEPLDGRQLLGWVGAVKEALEILKAAEPAEVLAAIWRMERDAEALATEAVDRLKAQYGGTRGLVEHMLREMRPGGGDGGGLDIRPPRRGGDGR